MDTFDTVVHMFKPATRSYHRLGSGAMEGGNP